MVWNFECKRRKDGSRLRMLFYALSTVTVNIFIVSRRFPESWMRSPDTGFNHTQNGLEKVL